MSEHAVVTNTTTLERGRPIAKCREARKSQHKARSLFIYEKTKKKKTHTQTYKVERGIIVRQKSRATRH